MDKITIARETLEQVITALSFQPYGSTVKHAADVLRAALAAQPAEPVALKSVHLIRDVQGMCAVLINGRMAIRDNGDIIDHFATLDWFADPPAQPAPAAVPPFSNAQLDRLYANSPEHHKDATSAAAFKRIVKLAESAHGIAAGDKP